MRIFGFRPVGPPATPAADHDPHPDADPRIPRRRTVRMTVMSRTPRAAVLRLLAVCAAMLVLVPTGIADAREIDCRMCHEDVTHEAGSVHADMGCQDCHSNVQKPRHKAKDLADLAGNAICVQCHRLTGRQVSESVHDEYNSCRDCHGSGHGILSPDDLNSRMSPFHQVETCGGCHGDPDCCGPEKAPHLIEGYIDSVHGRGLLRSGLAQAPSCSDCHGSHRIKVHDDPDAPTSYANAPEMCGACHVGILNDWRNLSAHGIGWAAGEEGLPVCTTCHASHEVIDPTSRHERLHLPTHCGACHGEMYESYRDGFHGKATNLGFVESATCSDCHTAHKNLGPDDPRSTIHPDNVKATCDNCHAGAPANFTSYDPHNDPTNPDDNIYVYWVYMFMIALLLGVFAFFGIHDLLWLQRALVGLIRGEYKAHRAPIEPGPYVRRFRGMYIIMHIVIVTTFLLLAATGLPLKFTNAAWAQVLADVFGGLDGARGVHRVAAIGTFGYAGFHLLHLLFRWLFKHEHGLFWGTHSMVPQWQDVKDFFGNLRYFLYLGPHPEGGRWTYWEKFDYLAVFWGVIIIGLSGLMLWIPEFFTRFVPGWTLNAAYVVHSDEALLATGFIFVFHFFHTHLRPESFPMDPVVFTGRMPLEKFKEERPREYQEMVEAGTLERHLCEAPTRAEMTWVYVFGFTALAMGLALAVGIFWALFTVGL
jgi:cytochrome b subunit of formate dehydrogenase